MIFNHVLILERRSSFHLPKSQPVPCSGDDRLTHPRSLWLRDSTPSLWPSSPSHDDQSSTPARCRSCRLGWCFLVVVVGGGGVVGSGRRVSVTHKTSLSRESRLSKRGKVAFRAEREASASPLWSQLSAQPRRPSSKTANLPTPPSARRPAMPPTPPETETETEPEFAEVDPTGRYGRVMPPFPSLPPRPSSPPPLGSLAPRSRAHTFRTLAVHGGSWQGRLQDGVSFHFHSWFPRGLRRLGPIWGRLTID